MKKLVADNTLQQLDRRKFLQMALVLTGGATILRCAAPGQESIFAGQPDNATINWLRENNIPFERRDIAERRPGIRMVDHHAVQVGVDHISAGKFMVFSGKVGGAGAGTFLAGVYARGRDPIDCQRVENQIHNKRLGGQQIAFDNSEVGAARVRSEIGPLTALVPFNPPAASRDLHFVVDQDLLNWNQTTWWPTEDPKVLVGLNFADVLPVLERTRNIEVITSQISLRS